MRGSINTIDREPPRAISPADETRRSRDLRLDFLLLGLLICLEVLVFGRFVGKIGFYLDDWMMLSTLHSGPKDLIGAFSNYFFCDPKVIIRPVEVLHFGILYFLFGSRPLGYHLVNGGLEICCSILLYFALKRFTGSRLLSFTAGVSFILYPIRDCTHYWILCSSVSLSLSLYLGSLILSMKGLQEKKPGYYLLAGLLFVVSIFNYEVFMPLACVTSLCVFLLRWRNDSIAQSFKQAYLSFLPLFLSGLALLGYQRLIVPHLGVGYLHVLTPDLFQILHVVGAGAAVSSIFSAMPFFQKQFSYFFMQPISAFDVGSLSVILSATSFISFRLLIKEGFTIKPRQCLELAGVGVAAIVASLSIFGLNREYEPTLTTLVNRIFTGASIGWSCIFAALVGSVFLFFLDKIKRKDAQLAGILILSAFLACGAVFFTLVNWQLAQPWVVSHRAQRDVIFQIGKLRGKFKYPSSIILSDFPRYVMWSPVFDGIWDFQSMVRVVLDDQRILAGVASDRLVIGKGLIKDVSVGYTCAAYPIKYVNVFIPSRSCLLPAHSAKEFVDIVETNSSRSFLDPRTIAKWRQQIEDAHE